MAQKWIDNGTLDSLIKPLYACNIVIYIKYRFTR
jgi:hypothetical protein